MILQILKINQHAYNENMPNLSQYLQQGMIVANQAVQIANGKGLLLLQNKTQNC